MRSAKAIAILEDCKGVWSVLTPQCASAARYRWVLAELKPSLPSCPARCLGTCRDSDPELLKRLKMEMRVRVGWANHCL